VYPYILAKPNEFYWFLLVDLTACSTGKLAVGLKMVLKVKKSKRKKESMQLAPQEAQGKIIQLCFPLMRITMNLRHISPNCSDVYSAVHILTQGTF
jgi:hypothetical protein